mgnify:CR=1 FL=1
METVAAAPRRPDRRPAQTIRKLLDAGAAELRVASFSALTMRSVAARAGVSPASAYTYFPSKNALVATLYLETLKTVAPQSFSTDNPRARVKAALRGMLLATAESLAPEDPSLQAALARVAERPATAEEAGLRRRLGLLILAVGFGLAILLGLGYLRAGRARAVAT